MLKIEYLNKSELKPYVNNAKIHTAEQVEQIKKSIAQFGFNDPIAIWHDNEVIEGHGRLLAVMEMDDIQDVPVIRLDDLSDEQRKAYTLVHNKLTMNTDFDVDLLNSELETLVDFDMSDFGFLDDEEDTEKTLGENPYTKKVKIPQYEPTGEDADLSQLVNREKEKELIEEINSADISEEEKEFLRVAAGRHNVFNYRLIAEYYANASKEMQKLMERSALVIIDVDDAIANGYVKLSKTLEDLLAEDDSNE